MRIYGNKAEKEKSKEYEYLKNEIPLNQFIKLQHPFPIFTPEPGKYSGNIAIVGAFNAGSGVEIYGQTLIGPVFEFLYIRDDRDRPNDPQTTHINQTGRIFGKNKDGKFVNEAFNTSDHYLLPDNSTSIVHIEENTGISYVNSAGDISELEKNGIKFRLGKFL